MRPSLRRSLELLILINYKLSSNLAKFLSPEGLLLNVEVTSKKRAFEEASLRFESLFGIERNAIMEGLITREILGSTCVGNGFAIPHARIFGLKSPKLILMRLVHPIPFGSQDKIPISWLFFLLVPEISTDSHFKILENIAEFCSNQRQTDLLMQASTAVEVFSVISGIDS